MAGQRGSGIKLNPKLLINIREVGEQKNHRDGTWHAQGSGVSPANSTHKLGVMIAL